MVKNCSLSLNLLFPPVSSFQYKKKKQRKHKHAWHSYHIHHSNDDSGIFLTPYPPRASYSIGVCTGFFPCSVTRNLSKPAQTRRKLCTFHVPALCPTPLLEVEGKALVGREELSLLPASLVYGSLAPLHTLSIGMWPPKGFWSSSFRSASPLG